MAILSLIYEMKKRILTERVFDFSAQLAYYFLMSIFPFLLLVVTLCAYLPFTNSDILELIRPYAPLSTYELIKTNLDVILAHRSGGVLSISLFVTIYLSSVGFQSIIRILDNAYRVQGNRPFWKEAILGFFLMFALLVALVSSLIFPVFGKIIGQFIFQWLGMTQWFYGAWNWIRWLLSSVILLFAFLSLYWFAPNTKVTFKQALPGAIFTLFGWQISSLAFSYYVSLNDYTHLYGNLGAIIILVGWFYWTAFILILGALLNASLCKVKARSRNSR
jgi:membrane protein